MRSYSLSGAKITAAGAKAHAQQGRETQAFLSADKRAREFSLCPIGLRAEDPADLVEMAEQFGVFVRLLDKDSNDYCDFGARASRRGVNKTPTKAKKRRRDQHEDSDEDSEGWARAKSTPPKARPRRSASARKGQWVDEDEDEDGDEEDAGDSDWSV